MIRLSSKTLSAAALSHLFRVQQRIDIRPDFLKKIKKAKVEWNGKSNSSLKKTAFKEIKDKLLTMCVGVEICNYCENNEATDIEHIYPKSLFPERAFRWENYLLACKTCNTHHKVDKKLPFIAEQTKIKVALKSDIMRYGHPTVWQELKRQRASLPKTNGFFRRAPEALDW